MALIIKKGRDRRIKEGREGRGREGRKEGTEEGRDLFVYITYTLYAYRYLENKITVSKSKLIHIIDFSHNSCHHQ